ncbi:hypothetical protein HYT23_01515 [Candidatus Pacearchaeota archaeon]|nr:hypothetical protein [Candidatus Pacearchaeota archaeon]
MRPIEKHLIKLIATDRISISVSSMAGKLRRRKSDLIAALPLSTGESFDGERAYARVELGEGRSRNIRQGIDNFKADYPEQGKILERYIEDSRSGQEKHLYLGTNPGCRLNAGDYAEVMRNLGFTDNAAGRIYPALIEASYRISRGRNEERSILIG